MSDKIKVFLDLGGPAYKIKVNGKYVTFEDHHYLGPVPINADGEERKLSHTNPFWQVVTDWYQTGKKVNQYGVCQK